MRWARGVWLLLLHSGCRDGGCAPVLRHGSVLAVTVAFLLTISSGCGPPPPPDDGSKSALPAGEPILMDAVVVDVDPDTWKLAVKDTREYATWTVVVDSLNTTIRDPGGGAIALEDLEIGTKVEIRGSSRVELVIDADWIDVEQVDPANSLGPLRR
jgi:hypothetical protein